MGEMGTRCGEIVLDVGLKVTYLAFHLVDFPVPECKHA
jgi:hypothetical protein